MVAVVAVVHGKAGAYGISFPDFQGCVAGGATVDEALRRGREGLTLHIEGMLDNRPLNVTATYVDRASYRLMRSRFRWIFD